jgi:hypothetical protein
MTSRQKAVLFQYGTGLFISVYLTAVRFPVPFYRSYSVRVPIITTRELKPRRAFFPLTLPVYTTSSARLFTQYNIDKERVKL